MHIAWIECVEFRNYRALSYTPSPNLNILAGPNAQGKTNLLESLAVLLVGRSFRAARPVELARWESGGARLAGELVRAEAARRLRRVVEPREDGNWGVAGEGCPWARAIPFGWQDLVIMNGAPQARRGFLDGFAAKLFPAHAAAVSRYRQVLGRRNYLLQMTPAGGSLAARLEPWDVQLARLGVEIVGRRRAGVAALRAELARLYPLLAGEGRVGLEYRSALGEDLDVAGFVAALEARRDEEIRRRQTLVGPHRDDLVVELDGRDMRSFGSRGQQRLLVLALRLAEARPVAEAVGSAPILLLDDALSELDPRVQARVLREVEDAGQVFLTTAAGDVPARAGTWWEVRGGEVTARAAMPVRGAA